MSLIARTAALRAARLLALVALLSVTALQVEEAGHWHQPGDGFAECLLCKSSAGTALLSLQVGIALFAVAVFAPRLRQRVAVVRRSIHRLARGPPQYS
ncbi:hypothetical protein E4634_02650 [Mangrovimicrobium sediminis]|uniref:DUF2946 domain-containing protein n=1 Tax=Mangrovimicrobium sediminis TaxID=2562682 RepID=A0A4Z0M8T3_9GAMM|nr:hypothetical protein [Haliea sp. SAOS-164]TGD75787.1 hypothetical protein E4634_02650 [Haliea sp. SAOS-164]